VPLLEARRIIQARDGCTAMTGTMLRATVQRAIRPCCRTVLIVADEPDTLLSRNPRSLGTQTDTDRDSISYSVS
jgi:hypothetical protein